MSPLTDRRIGAWPRHLLAVVGGATGIALFFAAQNLIGAFARGRAVQWPRVVGTELYYWYLLAAFLPLILALARRLHLQRRRWLGATALHSAAAVVIGIAHSLLYYGGLVSRLGGTRSLQEVMRQEAPTATMTVFWKYWVVVAVYYAFDYHRKYRERREHAARLEASLTEARLSALQMQLHPHFLFNTLHTVAMLNLEDPDAANHVLARLGELLRAALDSAGVQEVPLAEEIEFARRYLEIERVRLEDGLDIQMEVPRDLLDAYIPNLVLQPLVENAVHHGLKRGGRIGITALRDDDMLVLRVCDDGRGLLGGQPHDGDREGIGLSNTRARLAALYGTAWSLHLRDAASGGMCVEVALPLHRAPVHPGPRPQSELRRLS